MKFAPGPWKVKGKYHIVDADGENVAQVVADPTSKDNARLISAAPDLLDALIEAVKSYGRPGGPWNVPSDPGGWISRAKEAIGKAAVKI